MTVNLLELCLYRHYLMLNLFELEWGLAEWRGSLLLLEYDGSGFIWDFFFINGGKPSAAG